MVDVLNMFWRAVQDIRMLAWLSLEEAKEEFFVFDSYVIQYIQFKNK